MDSIHIKIFNFWTLQWKSMLLLPKALKTYLVRVFISSLHGHWCSKSHIILVSDFEIRISSIFPVLLSLVLKYSYMSQTSQGALTPTYIVQVNHLTWILNAIKRHGEHKRTNVATNIMIYYHTVSLFTKVYSKIVI